jgi:ankyrin repeat protein
MFAAVEDGDVQALKQILEANRASANVKLSNGMRPLHLAALVGQIDSLQVLLEHKADLTALDNHGRMPLHCVLEKSTLSAVQPILDSLEERNWTRKMLEMEDSRHLKPVHLAVRNGDLGVLDAILKFEPVLDNDEVTSTACPLIMATQGANLGAVQLLVEAGVTRISLSALLDLDSLLTLLLMALHSCTCRRTY